jgi:hypothetical protein
MPVRDLGGRRRRGGAEVGRRTETDRRAEADDASNRPRLTRSSRRRGAGRKADVRSWPGIQSDPVPARSASPGAVLSAGVEEAQSQRVVRRDATPQSMPVRDLGHPTIDACPRSGAMLAARCWPRPEMGRADAGHASIRAMDRSGDPGLAIPTGTAHRSPPPIPARHPIGPGSRAIGVAGRSDRPCRPSVVLATGSAPRRHPTVDACPRSGPPMPSKSRARNGFCAATPPHIRCLSAIWPAIWHAIWPAIRPLPPSPWVTTARNLRNPWELRGDPVAP